MELSRICAPEIFESSNCCQNHPPPVSEFLLGGIDNSPSKNSEQIEIPLSKDSPSKKPEQIEIPPSKDNPSKKRRNWGEGNGTIHWRTITRGGKDYPQAYYHWQEKGRKKTKYIPKQILGDIQEAEFKKRPIREILTLLLCLALVKTHYWGISTITLVKMSNSQRYPPVKITLVKLDDTKD
jgi:hypothetical protein